MPTPTDLSAPPGGEADRFGAWDDAFQPTASDAAPWLRGRIAVVDAPAQPDFVQTNVPGTYLAIGIVGSAEMRASQRGLAGGGVHYRDGRVVPRSIILGSVDENNEPHETRWSHAAQFMSLFVDPAAFASATEAAGLDLGAVEFLDRHPTPDASYTDDTLFALILAMRDELLVSESSASTADPAGRVYAESLMQAAAAHILRHHTARGLTPEAYTGGLTARQVARVRDYARAHLAADISLADLAAAADLSAYHFAREFKRSTGETAHGMLRRKRMEHAATALRETPHSVASVALDVGYASPSRFAAAFRKHTGVSPTVYRRDR